MKVYIRSTEAFSNNLSFCNDFDAIYNIIWKRLCSVGLDNMNENFLSCLITPRDMSSPENFLYSLNLTTREVTEYPDPVTIPAKTLVLINVDASNYSDYLGAMFARDVFKILPEAMGFGVGVVIEQTTNTAYLIKTDWIAAGKAISHFLSVYKDILDTIDSYRKVTDLTIHRFMGGSIPGEITLDITFFANGQFSSGYITIDFTDPDIMPIFTNNSSIAAFLSDLAINIIDEAI